MMYTYCCCCNSSRAATVQKSLDWVICRSYFVVTKLCGWTNSSQNKTLHIEEYHIRVCIHNLYNNIGNKYFYCIELYNAHPVSNTLEHVR